MQHIETRLGDPATWCSNCGHRCYAVEYHTEDLWRNTEFCTVCFNNYVQTMAQIFLQDDYPKGEQSRW